MKWQHKGFEFEIETRKVGLLYMASTPAQKEGMFVRVRPFSAIGRSEEEALELLKKQIQLEYRKIPAIPS